MKRFYKLVSVREDGAGYSILLDAKPVKTAAKNPLIADTRALADAIMQEWSAQNEKIVPADMPLTQLLSTSIDRVSAGRPAMTETVLEYLETDLLCYRTDFPPELAARQAAAWDPHLKWFEQKFGVTLLTTDKLGTMHQPAEADAVVRNHITTYNNHQFTVLQLVTALSGSAVLALAFVEGAADADTVFAAARVEEKHKDQIYDAAKYGPDPAQEKKDKIVTRDLQACAEFLDLLKA